MEQSAVQRILSDQGFSTGRGLQIEHLQRSGYGGTVFRVLLGSPKGDAKQSVVLKVINVPQHHRETDPWLAEREIRLYESGMLDRLPSGVSAPKCLGAGVLETGEHWLLLEDVSPYLNQVLEPALMPAISFRLGKMNAALAYVAGREAWLGSKLDRSYLPHLGRIQAAISQALSRWKSNGGSMPQNLERISAVIDVLEDIAALGARLPLTCGHGDVNMTNWGWRPVTGSQDELMLLDWAFAGWTPAGADLGRHLFWLKSRTEPEGFEEEEQTILASYRRGYGLEVGTANLGLAWRLRVLTVFMPNFLLLTLPRMVEEVQVNQQRLSHRLCRYVELYDELESRTAHI